MDTPRPVLWHSNSPSSVTGYGQQTALWAPRLQKAGYRVALSAFDLKGRPFRWANGIDVIPNWGPPFGIATLGNHCRQMFGDGPGLLFTLFDPWIMPPQVVAPYRTACWTPVDHETIPPVLDAFFAQSGARPVAMSQYGRGVLETSGYPNPLYVPHGIDTGLYSPGDQAASRTKLDLDPEAFYVGVVATNMEIAPGRKCWGEILTAFARFHAARRPNDPPCYLICHTEALGVERGIWLPGVIHQCGLPPEAVQFTPQYLYQIGAGHDYMVDFYRSLDVLLMPSRGEGFGLPAIEAQACGVPVIVTDATAQSELCGVGWKVPGQPALTHLGAFQTTPFISAITAALEAAYTVYRNQRTPHPLSQQAVEFASGYDVDLVLERHMLPTLDFLFTDAAWTDREPQPGPPLAVVPNQLPRDAHTALEQGSVGYQTHRAYEAAVAESRHAHVGAMVQAVGVPHQRRTIGRRNR